MSHVPTLTFITKEGGCSLCDDAFEEIEDAKEYADFEIEIVKLSEGDKLWQTYKHDFPVILIDGKLAFKHRTTRDLLLRQIRKGAQEKPWWKLW